MENNKILLVYRSMPSYVSNEPVDIMLTPQFYLVKKENIPVRTRYRAKKIAPSLFEGLIESSSGYEYFVYEEEDQWVFIAYDPEEIMDFLERKGLERENISKVYFAEQISSFLEKPVALGETEALAILDGTVVVIPQSVIASELAGSGVALPRPNRSISLENNSNKIFNKEQTMIIAAVFILFALIWFVEGWRYKKYNSLVQTKIENLYAKTPLLQSRYTRDNIFKKYSKIDTLERKKREIVKKIAGMISKGVTMEFFELNDKSYKVIFSVKSKKTAKRLEELLTTAGLRKSTASSNTTIVSEGKL